ncbi:hypothetical protein CEXT_308131 [Caerostris extrusa]|uniref:Uncharacterized protein n=1 Tax=Caerostris extrusa TaxID=172846 RepID=A0AAV4WM76_CAEEX|nr:hypothetical protein CEXT_308131 [Caerostris extrusa]
MQDLLKFIHLTLHNARKARNKNTQRDKIERMDIEPSPCHRTSIVRASLNTKIESLYHTLGICQRGLTPSHLGLHLLAGLIGPCLVVTLSLSQLQLILKEIQNCLEEWCRFNGASFFSSLYLSHCLVDGKMCS